MAEMACSEFEALLGDYIGRELDIDKRKLVAEHSLKCQGCRKLLDDIKAKLSELEDDGGCGTLPELDAGLETIPRRHGALDCLSFQELVTEFLDGFVPAPIYHKFVAHSDQCDECSRILTGVVYAVAACHSVHMNEELEVPAALDRSLKEVACRENKSADCFPSAPLPLLRRAAGRPLFFGLKAVARKLADLLPGSWPGYATASGLIVASAAMLFFGSPRDLGWVGIYRRAQSKPAVTEGDNAGPYAARKETQSRLDQMETDLGQAWKTIDARRAGGLAGGGPDAIRQAMGNGAVTTSLAGR